MMYKTYLLFLAAIMSAEAFFNERDLFMVHFNEFDDIINQMKSFRKELETLEENLSTHSLKEQKNYPVIHCTDNQKNSIITITNIPLLVAQKEINIDANVSYDNDEQANNIHITVGTYTIDINYSPRDHYISVNTVYQSSAKKEEKDAKLAEAFHYNARKGQSISGSLELESVSIEADHAKNILTITIPKTVTKSKHKKIDVTKVK